MQYTLTITCRSEAGCGPAGKVGLGKARCDKARQARLGMAQQGVPWLGTAGMAWRGSDRNGEVWQAG